MALWDSMWASDWPYTLAYEFPNLAVLKEAMQILKANRFFRYVSSSRLVGERWVGETGWDADKWPVASTRSQLGGVLYYKSSESLYTFSLDEVEQRSDERRARLDEAISALLASGGQRLGSYLAEWSSEWHLFVLYDFVDLGVLKRFNESLPDRLIPLRKSYVDYGVVLQIGTTLTELTQITRP